MLVSKILEFAREELAENKAALEAVEKELFRFNPLYDMTDVEVSNAALNVIIRIMSAQKRGMTAESVILISAMYESNKAKLPEELQYPVEVTIKSIIKGYSVQNFVGGIIAKLSPDVLSEILPDGCNGDCDNCKKDDSTLH